MKREYLIEKRKQKNLTQRQLAQKLGIAPAYLSQIEVGVRTPALHLSVRIARFFGVDVDELEKLFEKEK